MQVKRLNKRDLNYKNYIKRSAKEEDFDILVNEYCVGVDADTNEVIFIYAPIGEDTSELANALKTVKYQTTERSAGLVTNSRVFGFRPRITMRADFCSSASLSRDNPLVAGLVSKLGLKMQKIYEEHAPKVFAEHKKTSLARIKPQWLIKDTIYSSGIINKNNQLRYHFDSGNFTDVFSCMLVLKGGIEGGYLSVPEYGIGIEVKNDSVLMFNGQKLMHGVTPIKRTRPDSYRFSLVYYTLKTMWNCLDIDDEIARIKKRKTEREFRRVEMTEEKKQAMREAYAKDANGKQGKRKNFKL